MPADSVTTHDGSASDARRLIAVAVDEAGRRVHGVDPGAWHQPTPCDGWDVRAVAGHLVSELCWAPPLLGGATIAEVGDRFDGDLLGDHATASWDEAAGPAVAAAAEVDPGRVVHLSFGDVPAAEYLWQLTTDLAVHSWDLARATGQDEGLDPGLVDACLRWFRPAEASYRDAGAIGPAARVAAGAAPTEELLARFGRDPSPDHPLAVIVRFNRAFNACDLDAVMGLVTDDCVFVDTTPPDGRRHEGAAAVRVAFAQVFGASESLRFTTEEGIVHADRVVTRWRYDWGDPPAGHVLGTDVFRVRDGKVAEKLSYVKG